MTKLCKREYFNQFFPSCNTTLSIQCTNSSLTMMKYDQELDCVDVSKTKKN